MTIEEKILHGGAYLIRDTPPSAVFTPEDFTEEHRQIARTALEFTAMDLSSRFLEVTKDDLVVLEDGVEQKIDTFLHIFRPYGIKEMARTGLIALPIESVGDSKEFLV